MARRRVPENPVPVVREFNPDEIERGIARLKRRIEDVKALDPKEIRYDDARVGVVERSIRATILETFGPNSLEYQAHQDHEIYHGEEGLMDNDADWQRKFAAGIPATVTMVEGLIKTLDEKREDLGVDPVARAKMTFEKMDLHQRIADVCADLYRNEHYADAVFNAAKALINYVKERSGRHDLDGASLMRTVFSVNDPTLAFNDLKDQADRDEQEGMMHLFEGAALGIRNPRGHSFRVDSPQRALEYIGFLSLLANRVTEGHRKK